MARAGNKPYSRPPGGSDGAWTHDAFQAANAASSLSSRISSASSASRGGGGSSAKTRTGADLLSRISGGQGKELISAPRSKGMLGFQATAPANVNNANSGLELIPASGRGVGGAGAGARDEGRLNGTGGVGPVRRGGQRVQLTHGLVGSAMQSALYPQSQSSRSGKDKPKELFPNRAGARGGGGSGNGGVRGDERGWEGAGRYYDQQYEQQRQMEGHGRAGDSSISVMGRSAPKTVWVRVDCLAQGTTPEDVRAAFGLDLILSARPGSSSSSSASLVCIEVELAQQSDAEELVKQYDGVVADGNQLKVEVVWPALSNRLGGAAASGGAAGNDGRGGRGIEMGGDASDYRRQGLREEREEGGMVVEGGGGGDGGRELMGGNARSKMCSDTILASNPTSHITTLANDTQHQSAAQRQRANAWPESSRSGGGGSGHAQGRGLAGRVGAAGGRW